MNAEELSSGALPAVSVQTWLAAFVQSCNWTFAPSALVGAVMHRSTSKLESESYFCLDESQPTSRFGGKGDLDFCIRPGGFQVRQ
jgi:hypothetical protein